jgi:hypothetical protein
VKFWEIFNIKIGQIQINIAQITIGLSYLSLEEFLDITTKIFLLLGVLLSFYSNFKNLKLKK